MTMIAFVLSLCLLLHQKALQERTQSMAALNSVTAHCQQLSLLARPNSRPQRPISSSLFFTRYSSCNKRRTWAIGSLTEDKRVVSMKDGASSDDKEDALFIVDGSKDSEDAVSSPAADTIEGGQKEGIDHDDNAILTSRAINAITVLGFGTLAVTRLLTIDHDYWQGWTLYEVLRYAPEHNWIAYEQALKANPVLAKMAISGIVYSIGDWIAQCYEGKPLFEFDGKRVFRSGLVGFTLHGSLSHYYYQFCEALFPFEDWWVVPAKVAFDQTVWAAVWNSIYFAVLAFLRLESPTKVFGELRATFWSMLTAGWKLWPFAHLITYGIIPLDQRLLWVDCVELIWVTILSTYSNEKSEAQASEIPSETNSSSSSIHPEE